ncbi:MAG: hypothetical protein IPL52_03945 [Flavobacteriales bacterium]|nr:hypothetical protein [Flavobacteriales bacterium]
MKDRFMDKRNNWFLSPFADRIGVIPGKVDAELFALMSKHGVPQGRESIVDWERIEHHTFEFDFVGSEQPINEALNASRIITSPRMIVFCSMNNPLIELAGSDFCKHWHDLWAASGYMELFAISKDGKLIIEMTEHPLLFHSNFPIL